MSKNDIIKLDEIMRRFMTGVIYWHYMAPRYSNLSQFGILYESYDVILKIKNIKN